MDCANGAGAGAGAEGDRSKVIDFKEQILQLTGLACHEDEENSRTELLEKLCKCNKYTLVELCRSFDIPGSTGTKKDELVTIVMEFLMEHCSGINSTDPDKKVKKRKRKREGANLSGGKPSKIKKPDGSVLETHGEVEAHGRKGEEDRTKYSEFALKDNRNECTGDMEGQFPKEAANPEPSERVNGSVSEKLDAEQTLATTPSAKLVSNVEDNNIDMKASTKKSTSVTKKKATPKTDCKEKSCGKKVCRGDMKPRKQAVRPSRDELRQAVFVILDTANFATMTFGEVVKAVDKYFGKDLFERKPLIRSLIDEELFRLAEEAEKEELEEEEAIEAKARAEQASKEIAKDGRVGSDSDNANELQGGQDGKSKDAEKNENSNSIKGVKGVISVKAAENRNSNAAAESSQNGRAEGDTKNENNSDEFMKDAKAEKVVQNANSDNGVEIPKYGKAKMAKQSDNGNNIGCSEDGKTEEASNGENDDTEDHRTTEECRSGNGGRSAENVNDCQAEVSKSNISGEHVECAEDGKGQEAGNNNNSENTVSHGSQSKAKEAMENVNTEQRLTEADDDGKAEDAEHNGYTKVDVDSSKDGTAENGKTIDDARTNSDGEA